MSSPIHVRALALAFGLSAGVALAAQPTSSPRLHHTAPFLGSTLTLSVDGAPAFASVDLYFNTEAGTFATPYGTLELKRSGCQVLATGTADASGLWSYDLAVPLDPALAETGAHFQAIVTDSAAPSGRVLTDPFHGRYLGPRVYAGHDSGMYIVSALTDGILANVPFASISSGVRHEGKPVFDADFVQGAVMSTPRELLFFDPYFAGVLGTVPFANDCSRILVTDGARRTAYVLELAAGATPPRLHAIDLATHAETSYLDLPYSVEGLWCAGEPGVDVYVAEHDSSGTAIRRIGLDPLADLGSVHVGGTVSTMFQDLFYSSGVLVVSTLGVSGFDILGSLTRCEVAPSGLEANAFDLGRIQLKPLAAVPAVGRALAGFSPTWTGPAGSLTEFKLHSIRGPTFVPYAPTGPDFFVRDVAVDGTLAWILAAGDDDNQCPRIYKLDMADYHWTVYPFVWCLSGVNEIEMLHDALARKVWVPTPGNVSMAVRPSITVVDDLHGTSTKIRLADDVRVLHAVPLP